MPLKLTPDNYFTAYNTAISNSKVSDYLKSKEYYFKKHIAHAIPPKQSAPMRVGHMVDSLVTGEPISYELKVLKRDDPDAYEYQKTLPPEAFCTEGEFAEAKGRAEAITREPFFKWYLDNNAKFQVILHAGLDNGPEICGVADVITETPDTVYIDDFKASSIYKLKTALHWHWNCESMGYYRQLGVYSKLWKLTHPDDTREIKARHVVVVKADEGVYKVRLFDIPLGEMINGWETFGRVAYEIHENGKKEENFKDRPVTWNDVESLVFDNDANKEEEEVEELVYEPEPFDD